MDNRRARGGFHNISLDAGRSELARAVLEGVAFNLRWLLGGAEKFAGMRLNPIRLVGGGAREDLWCQILADVCDRSFERVAQPLIAGLRGCVLFFGLATGALGREEIRGLVPVDVTFVPDPGTRTAYDRLFRQYTKLHARNKAMIASLNAPTV